jgi:hypothetical protein
MDTRPVFVKHNKAFQRQAKIVQLDSIKTPEARKEHKNMFTFRIGRTKVNTAGFYERSGKHPVRCK